MSIEGLFSSQGLKILKVGLDAYTMRTKAIAENIANASTPGYQAQEVIFEANLRDAISQGEGIRGTTTGDGHVPITAGSVDQVQPITAPSGDPVPPGQVNNVVMERQMANLAQNELLFRLASQKIAGAYRTMKAAIRGNMR